MDKILEKWDEILSTVKHEHDISDISFDTWIRPLEVYGVEGSTLYILVPSEHDDSTSLMYCDYDTMQQLLLCSQPNCAHNTAACNGYLPYSAGGIVPEIVGQNLVLFYPGNVHAEENATLPRIETMAN